MSDSVLLEHLATSAARRDRYDGRATVHRPALVRRLLQGIEHKACVRGAAEPPANDPLGNGVDHEGDADEAQPSGDKGEVGDPEDVRRC
jgi:hypothetical protein